MFDMYHDQSGEFIGPTYWDTEPFLDEFGNYVVSSMKDDEPMHETFVFLLPAGAPRLPSPTPNNW